MVYQNDSGDCSSMGPTAALLLEYCISFGVSVSVLVVLCFLQRRRRLCLDCCGSRPSLPVPMDFLIEPAYRFPYIMIFAVMAMKLFTALSQLPDLNTDNIYLALFYKLFIVPFVVVVLIGIQYFPLLACVQASHLFIGHCIGLLCSLLWFSLDLSKVVNQFVLNACLGNLEAPLNVVFYVFQYIPFLLVTVSVVLWYLWRVIIECYACFSHRKIETDRITHHMVRVRKLLSGRSYSHVTRGRLTAVVLKMALYFVPYRKYVRFPLPFLCVVVGIVAFIYRLSFSLVFVGLLLLEAFGSLRNSLYQYDALNITEDVKLALDAVLLGLPTVLTIAPFLSLAICGMLLLHMMSRISTKINETAQKGFSEKLPAKVSRLPAAWKFLGLEMGLFICAWFIYYLIAVVAGLFIMVVILGFKYFPSYSIRTVVIFIVPLIWLKLVFYLQYLISKFIFFDDSSGKFISITNQRLFNWFSYVLFLYNGFAGFVGAILRIVITAAVSLLLLFRLDVATLIRGFDLLDNGHKAFLGFFYLYYCYNNAVVHTFIYIVSHLIEDQGGRYRPTQLKFYTISDKSKKQARNRWLVAYTLLKNPSIRCLRAGTLRAMRNTSSPFSDGSYSPIQEDTKIRDELIV